GRQDAAVHYIREQHRRDPQKAFVTRGNGNRPAPSPSEPLDRLPSTGSCSSVDRLIGAWPYALTTWPSLAPSPIEGDANKEAQVLHSNELRRLQCDRGFWVVSGARDPCGWGRNGWKGLAPALIYNRFKDRTLQTGCNEGTPRTADQFLVYSLTDTVDDFRAEFQEALLPRGKKTAGSVHDQGQHPQERAGNVQAATKLSRANRPIICRFCTASDCLLDDLSRSHVGEQRRFYISYNYGGCHVERRGSSLSQMPETVATGPTRNWRGSPPLLLYNRHLQNKPFHAGVDTAERMLVYLTHEVEDRRWKFRQPFITETSKSCTQSRLNIGKEAVDTFKHQQDYPIPSDRSLPPIYRSDLLDQMDKTIPKTAPFRTGVDYADRFVVYLTNHVDELRPRVHKSGPVW
uniref:Exostosin domain-containing protein n=1 Tax=Macrostomum lignano TaxID=282301 RepID=A0A1I8FA09_9PLAT